MLGHGGNPLFELLLGLDKGVDASRKLAVFVSFDEPDLGDEPVAQILHLRDDIRDTAVLGFQRREARLQVADLRSQVRIKRTFGP